MTKSNESEFCSFCSSALSQTLIDLGNQPYANNYLPSKTSKAKLYPLHVKICDNCKLVQHMTLIDSSEIFDDYGYFSSYSKHWLDHCKMYAEDICKKLSLTNDDLVIELASNDGYMLKNFASKGINVLGIDPAKNVAEVAIRDGIDTVVEYFGKDVAEKIVKSSDPDLVIANNVLAHVPDINDFVSGIEVLLRSGGICTIEFPHYFNLINELQFDTIYHEHFSYLSLTSIKNIFEHHKLSVFDVEKISTHGGSLRTHICHKTNNNYERCKIVDQILAEEEEAGIFETQRIEKFQRKVLRIKKDFLDFLKRAKEDGKTISCFGAAAKGNTFLNYVSPDFEDISFVVDDTPYKQNKFLPGSNIAIVDQAELVNSKPDYVVILPWNHKKEIIDRNQYIHEWGGKFVLAIPELKII
tara:strand:+ start:1159 stop:2394 length:1236 start_codon:yes stop_codon:yes gene_type:complete